MSKNRKNREIKEQQQAAIRVENNAKTTRGRPFEKGNTAGFKPGQSGNPGGRPKRTKISEALIAKLAEAFPLGSETSIADHIATALVTQAIKGNVVAAREIADRTEGKPRQFIELSIDDKRKTALQAILAGLIDTGLSEDAAKEYLANFVPETRDWIN